MLDKEKAKQLAAVHSKEVNKFLNPDEIILFGSFVNGEQHEYSNSAIMGY